MYPSLLIDEKFSLPTTGDKCKIIGPISSISKIIRSVGFVIRNMVCHTLSFCSLNIHASPVFTF